MSLLIDGYNVLYAVGILGHGVGPGTLERARLALLNFLAEALTPQEISQTTVVFDAAHALRDLPHSYQHRGLSVRFSVGYDNADAMLAELIRTASTPKRLTVVSGDREVQRAAKRRRAKAVDAETWWTQTEQRRRHRPASEAPARNVGPLSEEEVAFWLQEFAEPLKPEPPSEKPTDLENPFPPGYGEDLLEEGE
jgi:predicted RNA-binding protein with PIN domain